MGVGPDPCHPLSESAPDPPYNKLQFCEKLYFHIANLKFTVILLPAVLDSKLNSNKQNITHNSYLNKVHGIKSREGPRNSLAHAACACVVIRNWTLGNVIKCKIECLNFQESS